MFCDYLQEFQYGNNVFQTTTNKENSLIQPKRGMKTNYVRESNLNFG